jgi:hypothetical protein
VALRGPADVAEPGGVEVRIRGKVIHFNFPPFPTSKAFWDLKNLYSRKAELISSREGKAELTFNEITICIGI